ncbi:MAG TPA: hypothetical protein VEN47_00200, partial [Myxococcota bacterium]|nr:hypothetical protein [Myxococcota bacterium]
AEMLAGFRLLAQTEGILPALESAHAVAWVARATNALRGKRVMVNLSGRGDKDLAILDGAVAPSARAGGGGGRSE